MTDNVFASEIDDGFWRQSDVLQHICNVCMSTTANPWAVLAYSLLNVSMLTDPIVVVPLRPDGSGPEPLNLFFAMIGGTGQGKGLARTTARDAFKWPEDHTTGVVPGSAEGLIDLFVSEDGERKATAVLFDVDEIATWRTVKSRSANSIASVMRQLWNGDGFGGFTYRKRDQQVIRRLWYRLSGAMSVLPADSDPLVGREATSDGTTGRFTFLPTAGTSAFVTDRLEDVPPMPRPRPWSPPPLPRPLSTVNDPMALIRMPVAPAVHQEIHEMRNRDILSGRGSHEGRVRLRLAANLALLHQDAFVDETYWTMAGEMRARSEPLVQMCRDASATAGQADLIEREAFFKKRNKTKDNIVRILETVDGGRMTEAALKREITSGRQSMVGEALADLANEGRVECLGLLRGKQTETWALNGHDA